MTMPQSTQAAAPGGVIPKKILNFRRGSPPLGGHDRPDGKHGKDRPQSRDLSLNQRFHAMDIFHLNPDKRRPTGSRTASSAGERTPTKMRSPQVGPAKPAQLVISIESPPLVSYGAPATSSGALLSGQLSLTVADPEARLEALRLSLVARVTFKKPVAKDCAECGVQTTELKAWSFLAEPQTVKRGARSYPFSYLLPGHLPATTHAALGALEYVLTASGGTALEALTPVTWTLPLKRSLPPPAHDRASVRVFPPTQLRAEVTHPSLAHPIGAFPVHLRLAGLCAPPEPKAAVLRRWRIRKILWRLEESGELVSPACPRHAPRLGGLGKGLLHQDTRILGTEEMRAGWKTDFDAEAATMSAAPPDAPFQRARGVSELEFAVSANVKGLHPPPACDADDPSGLKVVHQLVLELVVAEEVAPASQARTGTAAAAAHQWNPSGTARVLRMTFALVLTERAGLGISWDEEQPPMYDDVPASPPGYARMDDYVGEVLPANDLDLQR